tara:strand:- start:46 stop:468 length:423 start_codon:yes stop_codon:yes gene_type:complete
MKRIPREKELAAQERKSELSIIIQAAMREGCLTKAQICKASKLKMHELNRVFLNDKELYAMFQVRRRTLSDIAADNIVDIISNKEHPSHFAATKFVLQKYKSDLDGTLESHEVNPMEVEIPGSGKGNKPTIIRFGKTDKK